ncbi:ImmA/IrrE family metallo-endopeptidase [Macrococcoides goetzii]|nr:ImmA/IrrE family metallo-endopeptidase [Macrococcus goetzii]
MSNRIELNDKVLIWAIKNSKIDKVTLIKKFNSIDKWIKNDPSPTYNQVVELSNFLNVPFGYLLLDEPPNDEFEMLDFRTIGTKEINKPSRNLIDTVSDMKRRQEWMKNFLIQEGYEKNHLYNVLDNNDDIKKSVELVRRIINLENLWFLDIKNDYFKFIKELLSKNGILIMQNGIVRNNTYRKLDVDEFRGFCLTDMYAPLIFINNNDSNNGKLFTLFHELIHVCLGEDTLYIDGLELNNKSEIFCNKIASELLIPTDYFLEMWNKNKSKIIIDKINELSYEFPVSNIAIARKSLDLKLINQDIYIEVEKKTNDVIKARKGSGGNFYNNNISRIDKNFILALSNKISNGESSFSDIYKLTGLKRNSFENIVKILEDVK